MPPLRVAHPTAQPCQPCSSSAGRNHSRKATITQVFSSILSSGVMQRWSRVAVHHTLCISRSAALDRSHRTGRDGVTLPHVTGKAQTPCTQGRRSRYRCQLASVGRIAATSRCAEDLRYQRSQGDRTAKVATAFISSSFVGSRNNKVLGVL